jgi:hypothetical protein
MPAFLFELNVSRRLSTLPIPPASIARADEVVE